MTSLVCVPVVNGFASFDAFGKIEALNLRMELHSSSFQEFSFQMESVSEEDLVGDTQLRWFLILLFRVTHHLIIMFQFYEVRLNLKKWKILERLTMNLSTIDSNTSLSAMLSLGSASDVRNFCSVSPRAPNAARDRLANTLIGEKIRFSVTSSAIAYERCVKLFITFLWSGGEVRQRR